MSKYLITPSLYNSYLYYAQNDFSIYGDTAEEYEKKAYEDWLNCLKNVRTPTTEVQQRGINFENAVNELTRGIERNEGFLNKEVVSGEDTVEAVNLLADAEYDTAKEIAEIVKGGIWQAVLMKDVDNYLLYGKSDVIKQNYIYDIKRVSSYDLAKYNKSIQHMIYMECADIENFEYLISDGESVFKEYYHREPDNLDRLLGKIDSMVNFIKAVPEFNKPFEANWKAREC